MKRSGQGVTLVWLALGAAAFVFLKWRDSGIEASAERLAARADSGSLVHRPLDSIPKPFARLNAPIVLKSRRAVVPIRKTQLRAAVGDSVPVSVTAYCLRGTTRTGAAVRDGIVAADPRVFSLGREIDLEIDGRFIGRFQVLDTGLLIKGRTIDLWMQDCSEARSFGRKRGFAVLAPEIRR